MNTCNLHYKGLRLRINRQDDFAKVNIIAPILKVCSFELRLLCSANTACNLQTYPFGHTLQLFGPGRRICTALLWLTAV